MTVNKIDNSSYTLGEAEAHIAGMREAAHIAEMYLHSEAAALIRNAVLVMLAGGRPINPPVEAAEKPAEGLEWYVRYKPFLYDTMDGRTAYRVYKALQAFETEEHFVQAPEWVIHALPNCGATTISKLIMLKSKINDETRK